MHKTSVKIKENNRVSVIKHDEYYTLSFYTNKPFIKKRFSNEDPAAQVDLVDSAIELRVRLNEKFLTRLNTAIKDIAATGSKKESVFSYGGIGDVECYLMRPIADSLYVAGQQLRKPSGVYVDTPIFTDGETVIFNITGFGQTNKDKPIKIRVPVERLGEQPSRSVVAEVRPTVLQTGSDTEKLSVLTRLVETYLPQSTVDEAALIYDLNASILARSDHALRILNSGKIPPQSAIFSSAMNDHACPPAYLIGQLAANGANSPSDIDYFTRVAKSALQLGYTNSATELVSLAGKALTELLPQIKQMIEKGETSESAFHIRAIGQFRDNANRDIGSLFGTLDFFQSNEIHPDRSVIRFLSRSCYGIQDDAALAILNRLIDMGAMERQISESFPNRHSLPAQFMLDSKPQCAARVIEYTQQFEKEDVAIAEEYGHHEILACIEQVRLASLLNDDSIVDQQRAISRPKPL